MRAIVYARQSLGKLKSIGEQIEVCTADATDQGWTVAATHRDRTSASRYRSGDREEWALVVEAVRAHEADVLVVWATSRADRDPLTWFPLLEACRVAGVLVRVTDDDRTYDVRRPGDWQTLALQGVGNAVDSDKISHSTKRGHLGAAREGKPGPGRTAYGYRRVYDSSSGELVGQEPDPATADVVREIFRRVASAEPLSAIARDLAERDVPRPTSGRWYPQRIREIAINPVYVGRRVHLADQYPGTWPALVDEQLWNACQRIFAARRTGLPGAQKHLLSYLAVCWRCEGPVYARDGGYVCHKAGHVKISQAATDELVLALVAARLARADVYKALRRASQDDDRETAAAWARVDELVAELEGWRRAAIAHKVTPESFAAIEAGLNEQITAARRRAEHDVPQPLRELLEPRTDVARRLATMPLAARRIVIARLIDPLVIGPARARGARYFDPTRLDRSRWRGDARTWRELRQGEVT